MISRVGTAAVAMVSEGAGRPVLICCETYKFAERVQLDSITANELGSPQALLAPAPSTRAPSPMAAWRDLPHLGAPACACLPPPERCCSSVVGCFLGCRGATSSAGLAGEEVPGLCWWSPLVEPMLWLHVCDIALMLMMMI